MLIEFLPFSLEIDTTMIAGSCLWSLTLYLGLASTRNWIIQQLNRWFNFAERSLYISEEEFEQTREARESQNAFYASVFSILPFFVLGVLSNYGVAIALGRSWAVSMGILGCMTCGIFELGRQDSQNNL